MSDSTHRIYLCGGPHCSARGREALLRRLEQALWARGLSATIEVRVSGCQDRCDSAPNITVWPGPWRYTSLTPEAIDQIVERHLVGGEPVTELLSSQPRRHT